MRWLHVTDTHLGAVGGRGALASLAARALQQALVPAFAGRVDAVVHTGDLFDRSEPPETAARFARALFAELGRQLPVVLLAGNHDRRGLARTFGPPPRGVTLVDTPRVVELAGARIGCLPHTREAADWATQAAELARRGVDGLAAHQSFDGQRVPGFVFRPGRPQETVGAEHLPAGVGWIASGHLHPRQRHTLGGVEIVCPGSAVRTSFREGPSPKGYAIWDLGAEPRATFVELGSPDWVDVRGAEDLVRVQDGSVVRVGARTEISHAERRALELAARSRGAVLLDSCLDPQEEGALPLVAS